MENFVVTPPIDYISKLLDLVKLEAFYTQVQTFIDDVVDGRRPSVQGEAGRAAGGRDSRDVEDFFSYRTGY